MLATCVGAPARHPGAPDPLQYDFPLPLATTLHPMGYPVRIETNSRHVIAAAEEVWNDFTCARQTPPLKVRIAVNNSRSRIRRQPPMLRGQDHLVAFTISPEDYAIADLSRGFIFGWVTEVTVSRHSWFRYHLLEPLVYLVLQSLYFTPVHAAAIALRGSALLLCGDSGAGKTCLAYACAKRGWTYVADDAVGIDRKREEPVAIGRPHHLRFRSSASELFPELAAYPSVVRPNGKPDLEVGSGALGLSIASEARIAALAFLQRSSSGATRVEPLPTETAFDHLQEVICVGEESVRREHRDRLRTLAQLPTFLLQYSTFEHAEGHLRSIVESCI